MRVHVDRTDTVENLLKDTSEIRDTLVNQDTGLSPNFTFILSLK